MDSDINPPTKEQIDSIISNVFAQSNVQEIPVDIDSYDLPETIDLSKLPEELADAFRTWNTAEYMTRFIGMGCIKDEFHDTREQRGNWRQKTENELRQQHGDSVADQLIQRLANNRLKINSINAIYGTLTLIRSEVPEQFNEHGSGVLPKILDIIQENYQNNWGEDRPFEEKVDVAEQLAQNMANFLKSIAAD